MKKFLTRLWRELSGKCLDCGHKIRTEWHGDSWILGLSPDLCCDRCETKRSSSAWAKPVKPQVYRVILGR